MPFGVQPGYEGYAALGDILGGGATTRARANGQKYLGQASDTAYKFNRASQERAKAIIAGMQQTSREGLPAALAGVYTDPKEAALAQAILGSAATPNMHNLDNFERPGYTALNAEQQDALGKGDFRRVNAITAVLGDKQFEPVIEKGGAYIANGATLGDLDAIPTPATAERIDQMHAQTAQGQQRTNAYVDKAHNPPARSHAAPHASAAADEAEVLAQARARIKSPDDARKVAEYLKAKGYPNVAKKLYQGP